MRLQSLRPLHPVALVGSKREQKKRPAAVFFCPLWAFSSIASGATGCLLPSYRQLTGGHSLRPRMPCWLVGPTVPLCLAGLKRAAITNGTTSTRVEPASEVAGLLSTNQALGLRSCSQAGAARRGRAWARSLWGWSRNQCLPTVLPAPVHLPVPVEGLRR